MPPQYFVKVISDRWMHAQTSLPISFKHLVVPDKFPAPTPLKDLYTKTTKDLQFPDVEKMYADNGIVQFNSVQT
jgi:pre-mRNA-splicing helicase BRR2